MTAICKTCPWRRGATADAIPNFHKDLACGLRTTVGDGSDALRPIMACHHATLGDERACGGYLAVVGYTNIAVRLALMDERMTMPDTTGIQLVDSFDEMLAQLI